MTAHPRLPATTAQPQDQSQPCWNARDLTAGGRSATIVLDGQAYTLRITRAGKLIPPARARPARQRPTACRFGPGGAGA